MDTSIQVNFNRPLPLFPLPTVVLLPHSLQHLHIFEERYKQMIAHSLDSSGQIAMARAVVDETRPDSDQPAVRSAVCVGQIMQHHRFDDGRYNLLVLGICRAHIDQVEEPENDRLYHRVRLNLFELPDKEENLKDVRASLARILQRKRLHTLRGMERIVELVERDDVPTQALIEVLGSTLLDDPERRYALLANPDVESRAEYVQDELKSLDRIIRSAQWQMQGDWPKGMSWN